MRPPGSSAKYNKTNFQIPYDFCILPLLAPYDQSRFRAALRLYGDWLNIGLRTMRWCRGGPRGLAAGLFNTMRMDWDDPIHRRILTLNPCPAPRRLFRQEEPLVITLTVIGSFLLGALTIIIILNKVATFTFFVNDLEDK